MGRCTSFRPGQIDDETTDRGSSFAEAFVEVISSEDLASS
jgi:hypothetical protein